VLQWLFSAQHLELTKHDTIIVVLHPWLCAGTTGLKAALKLGLLFLSCLEFGL